MLQVDAASQDTPAILFANGKLYAADVNGKVLTVDPASGATVSGGTGSLWIADWDSLNLQRIDPVASRQVAELPVPAYTLAFGAGAVWAVDQDAGLLIRLGPSSNRMVPAIRIPNGNAALAFADGDVWVASGADVLKIDPNA